MKFQSKLNKLRTSVIYIALVSGILACSEDPGPKLPQLTGSSEVFTLSSVGSSGISGTITFAELDNNKTRITIDLSGTVAGESHPSHIHVNNAAEGGGIALDLTDVDGATGMSETDAEALNDNSIISYDQLINFDGYVNIHNSASDLGTLLAQGDMGINKLTGMSEDYELFSKSDPNIDGEITFFERVSGETLAILQLEGDVGGVDHPSHIHLNTAAEGGSIAIDLSDVSGGLGITNIDQLNDGTAITFSELKEFDGYVNVHNSSSDLGTLVAQGDIGQNALTGVSVEHALNEINLQDVTGTITFSERENGFTLVTISISGAGLVGDHAAHIHNNDVATGGGVAISLTNVDVAGMSMTSVFALNDGTEITYNGLTDFNGYAQVHAIGGAPLTNGNIGSN